MVQQYFAAFSCITLEETILFKVKVIWLIDPHLNSFKHIFLRNTVHNCAKSFSLQLFVTNYFGLLIPVVLCAKRLSVFLLINLLLCLRWWMPLILSVTPTNHALYSACITGDRIARGVIRFISCSPAVNKAFCRHVVEWSVVKVLEMFSRFYHIHRSISKGQPCFALLKA